LERLSARCLLSESKASLHRAVLNVLDIALHLDDCYTTLTGEAGGNPPRRPTATQGSRRRKTRRRSRRLRKRDVVGFAEDIPRFSDDDSSDSDVDEVPEISVAEQSMSMGVTSVSFAEENLASRIDRMSNEMERLVRYIRRSAEKIGADGGPDTTTFEVLSFSLEDWDL